MNKTLLTLLAALTATVAANAISISLTEVTGSTSYDVSNQLELDLNVTGANAAFTFSNNGNGGSITSIITQIVFALDDSLFTGANSIVESTGVDFKATNGKNFFNPMGFKGVGDISYAKKSSVANGINNGATENLIVNLTLVGGTTQQNIIDSINATNTLIGLHVQSFADGGSAKYSAPPTTIVPDSGSTLALLGAALLGLIGLRSRKN